MILGQLRHPGLFLRMLLASASMLAGTLGAFAQAPASTPPVDAANQTVADAPLTYEVVSIKPNKSGTMMMRIMFTPDGISVSGVPVHMMLREAFDISDDQILGEPGWAKNDRFDIEAKVAAEDVPKLKALKPARRWAVMLPVFQDRFALKFHHETRDLTQYVLMVAKGGLKIKEATPDDAYADGLKAPDGKSGGGGMMRVQRGELIGQGIPLDNLVRFLSFQLQSPVIDKTGLTGKYDINLKWTPDETEGGMARPPDGSQSEAGNPAPATTTGPSIYTALEEQLGLKLEAHKEPGDVIVIDHIEQPSPN
jgi:uncharacterized protein (TIGR03435 family)